MKFNTIWIQFSQEFMYCFIDFCDMTVFMLELYFTGLNRTDFQRGPYFIEFDLTKKILFLYKRDATSYTGLYGSV